MGILSRRRFVASVALTAGTGFTRHLYAAAPPKESGLSQEGLLAGKAGFQPRTTMPLPHDQLPGFLSQPQLLEHHAVYRREVQLLKTAEEALKGGSADAGQYADRRRTQVSAGNSVLLHELYFTGLAPEKVAVPRYVEGHMNEHMGSFESWRADFTRCALTAKAWAVLVYDPYDDRWHNSIMDSANDGVWLGANPLVVCDVADHAFAKDYSRREEFVAKFVDHIDWEEIARRYRAVDRM
jgi:Fe-Mn family superoxide dismutase